MRKSTLIVTGLVSIIGLSACDKKKEIEYVEVEKVKQLACAKQDDFSIPDNNVLQMKEIRLARTRQYVRRFNCEGKVISDKLETFTEKKQDVELFSVRQIAERDQQKIVKKLNHIVGTAFNRQTCSSAKRDPMSLFVDGIRAVYSIFSEVSDELLNNVEVKEKRPSIRFTIDTAPALLTTEVNKGVQMIDYKFTHVCGRNEDDSNEYSYYQERDRHTRSKEDKQTHKNPFQRRPIKEDRICNTTFEEGTLVLAVSYVDKDVSGMKEIWPTNCNQQLPRSRR
ncbi:MAG: hypothetical protein H6625_04615 [Bdellovibrionaceae bacterium]|nr:hypothetical protein [Pseudobdellovibrionaceae bacterium]